MILSWVGALIRRRPAQFIVTSLGIAIAVALLAAVGTFVAVAQGTMTARAASNVPVDWQVQLSPGADVAAVSATVASAPGVKALRPVGFAQAVSFAATAGPTSQQTGRGVVLGLPTGYTSVFPGEIRLLTGSADGALVAQQTASNLHVGPGDTVTVDFAGAPVSVTVSGIVELPQANTLFQLVGASASSQPLAPPDNVILLPDGLYRAATAALSSARPDLLAVQLHVLTDRTRLSSDPATAYVQVIGAAHNLEVALVGAARIGNNLGASLDAARSDAGYAGVLFLFLGLPGAILAALLTIAFANADAAGRRRDDALLRLRGASAGVIARLAAGEAGAIAIIGGVVGLFIAAGSTGLIFGWTAVSATFGSSWPWLIASFTAGVVVALLAVLVPAVTAARSVTVAGARQQVAESRSPWWARIGLDLILIALGVVIFVITTAAGYSIVLAPEGVAAININYWAFLGPALLWVGGGLLSFRIVYWVLGRPRAIRAAIRPLTGRLAAMSASMLARRRAGLARSAVLLGVAIAFAASTAVFNSTYQQQAEVDARLTNGADIRVTLPAAANAPRLPAALAGVAGVTHVEPLQHRYAYVGADLQDLYGIEPTTIGKATSLPDAYFRGGTAASLLAALASTPDGVVVSAETATDYQLHPGDSITLRIVDGTHPQPTPVTFRYIGVALEFPTAPHDSFLIANASYIAAQTGNNSVDTYLVDTGGSTSDRLVENVRAAAGAAATVTPIGIARTSIGSSLTSVDLRGLTGLELGFAIALASAAAVLVLVLGLRERRRTVAIATLMGVSRSQARGLVLAEGGVVLVGGLLAGAALGVTLSNVLVAVLTGVFDPPPSALTVPWGYLTLVVVAVTAAVLAAALIVAHQTRQPPVEMLRDS